MNSTMSRIRYNEDMQIPVIINDISETWVKRDWEAIVHYASDSFWAHTYEIFSAKESSVTQDGSISFSQAFILFDNFFSKLSEEMGYQKKISNYHHEIETYPDGFFGIYLEELPEISLYIDFIHQIFTVSCPDYGGDKDFKSFQVVSGLSWLQECFNYLPLWKAHKNTLTEKFFLDTKNVVVSMISVKTLVESFCKQKKCNYKIVQYYTESEIIVITPEDLFYYIKIYHKPFLQDPYLLINILDNPQEKQLQDKIDCQIMRGEIAEMKEAFEAGFYSAKKAGQIEEDSNFLF